VLPVTNELQTQKIINIEQSHVQASTICSVKQLSPCPSLHFNGHFSRWTWVGRFYCS